MALTATCAWANHSVAEELRRLDVGTRSLISATIIQSRIVLPAGSGVGSAEPFAGYAGRDRDLGRYTIRYPGAEPVNQYEPRPPEFTRRGGLVSRPAGCRTCVGGRRGLAALDQRN